jgi:hypothetical protein
MTFLDALGKYIVHKKPDVIIQLGDFADMHSLSSYDKGRLKGEGARVQDDLEAARTAMDYLLAPIFKARGYNPRMVLTLGNHEERIARYVEANPNMEKFITYGDLPYWDWEVYNFLEPVEIDGIYYCHYFPRNASGRIVQSKNGAPNAKQQVMREMKSCTSGHLQGLDYYIHQTATRRYHGLIAGSFYQHEEDYLTPQGTAYWRGVIVKHEVDDGQYDPMFVSMDYLLRNYS